MDELEKIFKKGFYTMAMVRTVICLILLLVATSCGTVEWAYSEASWATHQIHFQENMDMPNCQWCIDYNTPIP
tara:strand:+ start:1782 stop:2000 length:219 start_codon:yes stop_codon:yes gene_type:complete